MLIASPAAAQISTIARSGAWQAYAGIADDGKRVCGVIENGADGRTFSLKYFQNADNFQLLIGKDTWDIPRGTSIDVSITFDQYSPWSGHATGNGKIMFLTVPLARMSSFVSEFKAATTMRIFFPSGSEAPWRGTLIGSTAILASMAQCLRDLRGEDAADSGPSQPFTSPRAEPTQPFNAPSQPYANPANAGKRRFQSTDGTNGGAKD